MLTLLQLSYNGLSLIVAFVFAGIMLVFFIKILNLTVSQGTLNGLIFYANIVGASQPIVFPNSRVRLVDFLATFISWVNRTAIISIHSHPLFHPRAPEKNTTPSAALGGQTYALF